MGYGADVVSPLGRVGEVARQLHAISAGGASKLKWETVPVPYIPTLPFQQSGQIVRLFVA